ncbi:MAG: sugar-binding protein, partial [Planctomycetota bacterium]
FKPSSLAVTEQFVAVTGRHEGEAVGILVDASSGKVAGDVTPPGATRVSAWLAEDLFCLGTDRGIHAYGPLNRERLDQRVATLAARYEGGDQDALAPLANALYQAGEEERAVELLAEALTDEGLTHGQYGALKDQLNSLREAAVGKQPPTLVARRFETPPSIDGAIDEPWRRDQAAHLDSPASIHEIQGRPVAESRWTSPSDLSARLYLGWDARHLYFAIDVTDDIHRTYTSMRDTWVGDGLIISIDCDNDGGFGYTFTGRDLLLTLALTRKDERRDDQDEDDSPKGAYRVRRKDDNSGTVYECAIPWEYMRMPAPRPGQRIGFNITVTDDDGDRAAKAVSWTPGMVLDRDRAMMIRGFTPAWFGDVLLEDAGAPPRLLKPPAVLQPDEAPRRKE